MSGAPLHWPVEIDPDLGGLHRYGYTDLSRNVRVYPGTTAEASEAGPLTVEALAAEYEAGVNMRAESSNGPSGGDRDA